MQTIDEAREHCRDVGKGIVRHHDCGDQATNHLTITERNKMMKKTMMLMVTAAVGSAVLFSGCSDGVGQSTATSLTNEIAVLSRKLEQCNAAINAQNLQIETLRNALSNAFVTTKVQLGNVETAVETLKVNIDRNLLNQRGELERLSASVTSNNLSIVNLQRESDIAFRRTMHIENDILTLCNHFQIKIDRYRW